MASLTNKRLVIIGSGIGGAGGAALLAKQGARPIVVERSALVGGKAGSYTRNGFNMEVGIHISARGENGPLAEVATRSGAKVDFINKSPMMQLIYGTRKSDIPQSLASLEALYKIFRTVRPSVKALPSIIRFALKARSIKSESDATPYFGVSAKQFISEHVRDPDLQAFLDYCSGLMFVLSTEEASAGEFLVSLNNWFETGSTAYPRGGYGAIPQAYLDVCTQAGGSVLLGETVEQIAVEDGQVLGVQTDKGFHEADIVVSNAGIVRTIRMAGEGNFPAALIQRSRSLKDSHAAIVVKYALDAPLSRTPFTIFMPQRFDAGAAIQQLKNGDIPDDIALYITSPTTADPGLAPPGKHIMLACTGAPSDMLDKELNNRLLDKIEEKMEALYPSIREHTLWKQRHGMDYMAAVGGRGAGEAIGLAQRFDQDGDNCFSVRMPVTGLYVVGADTGGCGIGTEKAALSALRVCDAILEDIAADERSILREQGVGGLDFPRNSGHAGG